MRTLTCKLCLILLESRGIRVIMDWTPFINWLIEHGPRILLIIVAAVALYYILRHFVPIMIKRTVSRTMIGKPKTAIKKRTATLSNVFIETGMVFVGVVALFMIVSELGMNIAPALAGLTMPLAFLDR